MEILRIGILLPGGKARLPDMENFGDYTGGPSGKHLMDDNTPRLLGMKETVTRPGVTSMRF
jgi:hypothetical protein